MRPVPHAKSSSPKKSRDEDAPEQHHTEQGNEKKVQSDKERVPIGTRQHGNCYEKANRERKCERVAHQRASGGNVCDRPQC